MSNYIPYLTPVVNVDWNFPQIIKAYDCAEYSIGAATIGSDLDSPQESQWISSAITDNNPIMPEVKYHTIEYLKGVNAIALRPLVNYSEHNTLLVGSHVDIMNRNGEGVDQQKAVWSGVTSNVWSPIGTLDTTELVYSDPDRFAYFTQSRNQDTQSMMVLMLNSSPF